jgi:predicted SAM-dependent methyltransferase
MLHIAPEACLEKKLKNILGDSYITADLNRPDVRVKMDITSIPFPESTYDVIYCSHVLEHVPDDRKALREFYRVLKPTGWLLLLVPVNVEKTFEDASVTDPQKRLELFGQDDHVRKYGPDVMDRIQEAGFKVKRVLPGDFLAAEQIIQYGITANAPLFYCTK